MDSIPAVILVRPREEGNIGSVARAMANMGLSELILVEPAPVLAGVARGFGVGGWDVLDGARRVSSLEEAVADRRRVVGTSAGRERGRALGSGTWMTARELAAEGPFPATALVFGPEDTGLRRDELELCHRVVRIPCAPEHPTLNLAQAVLILAYELFLARVAEPTDSLPSGPLPSGLVEEEELAATAEETAGVLGAAGDVFRLLGFDQDHVHGSLMRDAGRLLRRSGASSHETRVLWRILNRARSRLEP